MTSSRRPFTKGLESEDDFTRSQRFPSQTSIFVREVYPTGHYNADLRQVTPAIKGCRIHSRGSVLQFSRKAFDRSSIEQVPRSSPDERSTLLVMSDLLRPLHRYRHFRMMGTESGRMALLPLSCCHLRLAWDTWRHVAMLSSTSPTI